MDVRLEAVYVEDVVAISGLFVVKVCLIEVCFAMLFIHKTWFVHDLLLAWCRHP